MSGLRKEVFLIQQKLSRNNLMALIQIQQFHFSFILREFDLSFLQERVIMGANPQAAFI